jgi:hypothetical protein
VSLDALVAEAQGIFETELTGELPIILTRRKSRKALYKTLQTIRQSQRPLEKKTKIKNAARV